ncbi:translation initiation factor SUI1 [Paraphysoderma sedebokerense]|nr:translation initiation factor SUI1 [Paraphysoderma sedebokerense]
MATTDKRLTNIIYCGECSLPPEYCEFSGIFSKCKTWLQKNHPQLFEKLYTDQVAEKMSTTKLAAPSGESATASTSEESSATAEGTDEKKKSKRGGKANAMSKEEKDLAKKMKTKVIIKSEQRKGRKMVTVISGLDAFEPDLKKATKLFSQKFATGSSITKSPTGTDDIVIQGDVTDGVYELILSDFKSVPEDNIVMRD